MGPLGPAGFSERFLMAAIAAQTSISVVKDE